MTLPGEFWVADIPFTNQIASKKRPVLVVIIGTPREVVHPRSTRLSEGQVDHPNKHIREAIEYAENNGWRVTKAGPRAHVWGTLWCPHRGRDGCRIRIMSTPRHPEDHARNIRRTVDRCPHGNE